MASKPHSAARNSSPAHGSANERNRRAGLWLTLEATAGDSPDGIAAEMVAVADRLDLPVQVNFNGYQMLAMPGASAAEVVEKLERQIAARR